MAVDNKLAALTVSVKLNGRIAIDGDLFLISNHSIRRDDPCHKVINELITDFACQIFSGTSRYVIMQVPRSSDCT